MKVIIFTSKFCPACTALKLKLGKKNFIKYKDIEEDETVIKKYKLYSVPTAIILNDKNELQKKVVGYQSILETVQKLEK